MNFPSTVLSMRLNKLRIIICFSKLIHVYDLTTMERLLALQTGSNENGVLALSNENTCYLAFPSGPLGGVVLYDCISLRLLNQLDAHKNAICAVEFNK